MIMGTPSTFMVRDDWWWLVLVDYGWWWLVGCGRMISQSNFWLSLIDWWLLVLAKVAGARQIPKLSHRSTWKIEECWSAVQGWNSNTMCIHMYYLYVYIYIWYAGSIILPILGFLWVSGWQPIKIVMYSNLSTLPKTNIVPENGPPQ